MSTITSFRSQDFRPLPRRLGPFTVGMSVPLTPTNRALLEEELGPEYEVIDIRRAPVDVDLLVVPPCSPQAVEGLLRDFPRAQVLVVEDERDPPTGAVERVLAGGAASYSAVTPTMGAARRVPPVEPRKGASP